MGNEDTPNNKKESTFDEFVNSLLERFFQTKTRNQLIKEIQSMKVQINELKDRNGVEAIVKERLLNAMCEVLKKGTFIDSTSKPKN